MALTRAVAGGGDFGEIKEALLELAKKEVKVVFRTLALHEETQMENGTVQPVTADMIVCTGPNKGKVLLDYRHIGRGVTGPLRRAWAAGDKEVAARLEQKTTGATKWVAAQTPNDDDFELISGFYGDGSVWAKGTPLVEGDTANASGTGSDSSEPPF